MSTESRRRSNPGVRECATYGKTLIRHSMLEEWRADEVNVDFCCFLTRRQKHQAHRPHHRDPRVVLWWAACVDRLVAPH